jgi:fatty acid desaturase
MVVVVRVLKGLHPAKADRSHLHHRLEDALPSRKGWVVPILLLQAAACAAAVVAKGWVWAIPVAGLLAFVGEALLFSIQDLRAHRGKRRKVLKGHAELVPEGP